MVLVVEHTDIQRADGALLHARMVTTRAIVDEYYRLLRDALTALNDPVEV